MVLNQQQTDFLKVLNKTKNIVKDKYHFYGGANEGVSSEVKVCLTDNELIVTDKGYYILVANKSETPFKDIKNPIFIDRKDFTTSPLEYGDDYRLESVLTIFNGCVDKLNQTHTLSTLIDKELLINFLTENKKYQYVTIIKNKIILSNLVYDQFNVDVFNNPTLEINLGYTDEPEIITKEDIKSNSVIQNYKEITKTSNNIIKYSTNYLLNVINMFPKKEKLYIRLPLSLKEKGEIFIETENYGKILLLVRGGSSYSINTKCVEIYNLLENKLFLTYKEINEALHNAVKELGYTEKDISPLYYGADNVLEYEFLNKYVVEIYN